MNLTEQNIQAMLKASKDLLADPHDPVFVEYIDLNTWDDVREYVDACPLTYSCSTLAEISSGNFPADAFSLGQLASKAWMLSQYNLHAPKEEHVAVLLGCWMATVVQPWIRSNKYIERIWGFDIDQDSVDLANKFNMKYVNDSWHFKAVKEDVTTIDWKDPQFEVEGQLIETKPDVIVNTSAEHMDNEWFDSIDESQLVIIQSNNSPNFEGHINTCTDIIDAMKNYPLRDVMYAGEMTMPLYKRLMLIGKK